MSHMTPHEVLDRHIEYIERKLDKQFYLVVQYKKGNYTFGIYMLGSDKTIMAGTTKSLVSLIEMVDPLNSGIEWEFHNFLLEDCVTMLKREYNVTVP